MAQLSGMLKREAPAVRDAVGPIRKFIASNAERFELVKEGGRWVVLLHE